MSYYMPLVCISRGKRDVVLGTRKTSRFIKLFQRFLGRMWYCKCSGTF